MPRKHPAAPKGNRSFLRPKTSLCGPEAPFRFVLNRLPDRLPDRLPGRLPSIRRCFAPDFFCIRSRMRPFVRIRPVLLALSVRPDSARFDRAWFACLRSVCGLSVSRPRSVSFALPAARLRLFFVRSVASRFCHGPSVACPVRPVSFIPSRLVRPALPRSGPVFLACPLFLQKSVEKIGIPEKFDIFVISK